MNQSPPTLLSEPGAPVLRRVIEPGSSSSTYWSDLLRYRELLFFLAWRDIIVQYKQTVFGLAWAIIRPALPLVVFTVVFGQLANLPSGGTPYPLLVLAGLLPWQLFAVALADIGNSIVGNGGLVSKIYFPRLIVPLGAVVRSLIDFAIASLLLVALMAWYGVAPDARIFALPLFFLIAVAAAFGAGVWAAALSIKYRDFRFIVPLILQFGLYISPVGFSSAIVPEKWRLLYAANPMVAVIDGFRWSLLGGEAGIYWPGLLLAVAIVSALLLSGVAYFRKTERTFADLI